MIPKKRVHEMADPDRILGAIHGKLKPFLVWMQDHRTPLTVSAGILFFAGLAWSVHDLHLGLSDIALLPALVLLLILAPLSLVYGAIGLRLLARVADRNIGFFSAIRSTGAAQLAEVLPLPGGAIVRTGALMSVGIKAGQSAALVFATAGLWIALAAAGAGYAVHAQGNVPALPFVFLGLLIVGIILVWIVRQAGWPVAVQILVHRIAGVFLTALRLSFAFAIVKLAIPMDSVLIFSFASIAGSAAAIAPAGLGISEAFAAILAPVVAVGPAIAFFAVAINRLLGLSITVIIVMMMEYAHSRKIRRNSFG